MELALFLFLPLEKKKWKRAKHLLQFFTTYYYYYYYY